MPDPDHYKKCISPKTRYFKNKITSFDRFLQKRIYKQRQQKEHQQQENCESINAETKPERLPDNGHFVNLTGESKKRGANFAKSFFFVRCIPII